MSCMIFFIVDKYEYCHSLALKTVVIFLIGGKPTVPKKAKSREELPNSLHLLPTFHPPRLNPLPP